MYSFDRIVHNLVSLDLSIGHLIRVLGSPRAGRAHIPVR
jgi:hypothetical protein